MAGPGAPRRDHPPWRRGSILLLAALIPVVLMAQGTNQPPSVVTNAAPERVEHVQMDVANGFLNREFYELAASEYEKYLEWFPTGGFAEEAMYRLADCLRGQGKPEAARRQYEAVQKKFPTGNFFARAAFRQGEMDWNEGRHAEALKHFVLGGEKAESQETRLTARFYQARTLIQLKRVEEAIPVLRELGRVEKENPYRGFALLELARALEGVDPEEAGIIYARVLDLKTSSLLRAEAGTKAALLEMKNGQWTAAAALLEKVRKLDVPDEWVTFANLQLVRSYYQADRYEPALKILQDPKNRFPPEAQAELDLLHAHSLRLLKKYKEAVGRYDIFLKNHPGNSSRESAAYERVVCLYATRAGSWDAEAALFLQTWPAAVGAPQFLCWRADHAFRRQDYAAAAVLYSKLPTAKLKTELVPEALYQHGVSLAQTGQHDSAAEVLGEFIKRFPDHALAANTLFQRGLVQQRAGRFKDALASFGRIAERFPKSPEHEPALYRIALLHGELKQHAEMREAFRKLGAAHPTHPFATDAAYWTGWSLFEERKYREAIPHLEKARKGNPKAHGAQATSRLILAHYQLGNRPSLLNEVESLPAASAPLAAEIYDWLARESAGAGDHDTAERYFRRLLAHPEVADRRKTARWGLAQSLAAQAKWKAAIAEWESYEKDYSQPAEIVATRLQLVRAHLALTEFPRAQELAEDVLRLQPEGRNNAEARYLLGEIMARQEKHTEAARYFLSVAVLYEDPEITPRSLSRAIQSFEAAGDTNQVQRLREELERKYPRYK